MSDFSNSLLDNLKAIFLFFKNPDNQHLATWCQTIAIVVGVIVALGQLNSIAKQEQLNSNKIYMDLAQKYYDDVNLNYKLVHKHYVDSKSLNIDEFNKLYPEGRILESRKALMDYFEKISNCSRVGACPNVLVNDIVCSQSKLLFEVLKEELKSPDGKTISDESPLFYETKIKQHCSIIDATLFWGVLKVLD